MCQWDVTHGRRRYSKISTSNAGTPLVIKPNRFRVGIIFSGAYAAAGVFGVIYANEVQTTDNVFATLTFDSPVLMLRIEDHGTLVTGGWNLDKTGVGVNSITEILVEGSDYEQLQN